MVTQTDFVTGKADAFVKLIDSFRHANPAAKRQRDDVNVLLVAQQMAAQSNQRVIDGFQNWLGNVGVNWQVEMVDAAGDAAVLASSVESAVTAGIDAIIIAFGTLTETQDALQLVGEAGIPLLTVDSGFFAPSIADITSNNYVMGSQMGSYLVQRLLAAGKTEPNILRVTADFHHGTRKRGKGLDIILSENENITVLNEEFIQYEGFFETTSEIVSNWVDQYGEDIDAVWCPWDEPAQAAAQALLDKGLTVEDVFVIGADGHPPAVDAMRSEDYPLVATPAQAFELWGALAASFVDEIVGKGRDPREVVPVVQVDFPAPFIVKEVNVPSQGLLPWQTSDFYQLFLEQAQGDI